MTQDTLGTLSAAEVYEEGRDQTHQQDLRLLFRLLPFFKGQRPLLVFAIALMPLTSLVALVQPYLLKLAIDAAIVQQSETKLGWVTATFFAVLVAEFTFRFAQIYTLQLVGQRAIAQLRRHVFHHLQRMRLGYFDQTPVGKVVTRVTNDVDSLGEFFGSGAITAIADLFTLFGIIGFMLYIDWELSLVTFVAIPPLAVVVNLVRKKARLAFREIRAQVAQLNGYLAEQIEGIRVVQSFQRELRCQREYDTINARHRDANIRAIRYDALLYSIVESIAAASVAIVLWYASSEIGLTDATRAAAYVGTVVAFYEYIQKFFIPIRDLATKYTLIQHSLAAAERVFGLLDRREFDAPSTQSNGAPAKPSRPLIDFEDVYFSYRDDVPVLRGLNLSVHRGQIVALVGATGSGKSTIVSTLLRLYEIERGTIYVDGVDHRSLPVDDLRRRFAVVPQDVHLFAGTVVDNVAFGKEVDKERVQHVLKEVGLWDLLSQRPDGIRAAVDEGGRNFSLGERQLIAFARALYRDPDILLLDEATANIDSETEYRVQNAVARLTAGRTSIVIAHRLSTIRSADRIYVIHRGAVAEAGDHGSLLVKDGIYARLHRLQFEQPEQKR